MELWWQSLGLQLWVLPRGTFLISSGNNIITCNFKCFAAKISKANKLPLEMELVVHDNSTHLITKLSSCPTQLIMVVLKLFILHSIARQDKCYITIFAINFAEGNIFYNLSFNLLHFVKTRHYFCIAKVAKWFIAMDLNLLLSEFAAFDTCYFHEVVLFLGCKKCFIKLVGMNCFYKINNRNWACYFWSACYFQGITTFRFY